MLGAPHTKPVVLRDCIANLMSSVEGVVWSVSVGSIEPFHEGVDDVFWIEHNFEDANLRDLNSCSM